MGYCFCLSYQREQLVRMFAPYPPHPAGNVENCIMVAFVQRLSSLVQQRFKYKTWVFVQKQNVICQWSTAVGSACCLATGIIQLNCVAFFFLSGVLEFFHSRKHFSKVLILSMLQNSACSQVNQGCAAVLLKELLMKVAQCFAAHARPLNSQSMFTRPLFDDESLPVVHFAFVSIVRLQITNLQSAVYNLAALLTCTHAVRYKEPPV